MSVSLMSAAWEVDLPSTRKFVLVALCDNANDQGECYPSIPMIAAKCSLKERVVYDCIRDLEADGYLRRESRPGRRTIYHINPCTKCTPAYNAPLHNMHPCTKRTPAYNAPTPAPDALSPPPFPPHPPLTPTPEFAEPSLTRQGAGARAAASGRDPPETEKPKNRNASSATRISPDWKPTNADIEFATAAGIEPQDIPAIADRFRDYWLAKPGIDGTKLDWAATWRNWIRREAGSPGPGSGGKPGGNRRDRRTSADAFAELLAETPPGNLPRAGLRDVQIPPGCNSRTASPPG